MSLASLRRLLMEWLDLREHMEQTVGKAGIADVVQWPLLSP